MSIFNLFFSTFINPCSYLNPLYRTRRASHIPQVTPVSQIKNTTTQKTSGFFNSSSLVGGSIGFAGGAIIGACFGGFFGAIIGGIIGFIGGALIGSFFGKEEDTQNLLKQDPLYAKQDKYIGIMNNQSRNIVLETLVHFNSEFNDHTDIKKIYENFLYDIQNKQETELSLFSMLNQLRKIEEESHKKGDYNKLEKAIKLRGLIGPVYKLYINNSSKSILHNSDSGSIKYPKKHSIFASTTQESFDWMEKLPERVSPYDAFKSFDGKNYHSIKYGGYYSRELANNITKENTIVNALKKTKPNSQSRHTAPVHRLTEGYTELTEEADFEVLFITGSGQDHLEQNTFILDRMIIAHSISSKYQIKCKGIHIIDEPTEGELNKCFESLSKGLNGKRLYIFYIGHGTSKGIQDGVSNENIDKQGSCEYSFEIKKFKDNSLRESYIKGLYNKYFNNIEVISIFQSCHSGAAVTAIENEELKKIISSLA